MKILVTGSEGFIGKNLINELYKINSYEILSFKRNQSLDILQKQIYKAVIKKKDYTLSHFFEYILALAQSLAICFLSAFNDGNFFSARKKLSHSVIIISPASTIRVSPTL